MKTSSPSRAFSLIEVVFALGITSFCIVALVGLFAVGMKTEKESEDELQAAHIAQRIMGTLRSYSGTQDVGTAFPDFPIPKLAVSDGEVELSRTGEKTSSTADQRYALEYKITALPNDQKTFTVYLKFRWPAQAPAAKATGTYELVSVLPAPVP